MSKTPPSRARARRSALYVIAALVVTMLALAAAWQWTPLHEYAEPRAIAKWLRGMALTPWAPLIMAGVFVAASLVMFPNTVLSLAVIMALGPMLGAAYCFGGSLAAALAGYLIGRRGGKAVEKLKIGAFAKVSEQLRRGGFAGVLTLRLLPAGPFSVTNILAGAARVNVFAFLSATLVGIAPYILTFAAFGRQTRRLLSDPSWTDAGIALVIVALSAGAIWQIRSRAARH